MHRAPLMHPEVSFFGEERQHGKDRMSAVDGGQGSSVRYQPDERPPVAVALGLGLQFAVISSSPGSW